MTCRASAPASGAAARLVRGLPGYPVGAVLLARLAVNGTDQGEGLGSLLLTEALRKAVAAGEHAAALSSSSTPSTTKPLPSTAATGSSPHPNTSFGSTVA